MALRPGLGLSGTMIRKRGMEFVSFSEELWYV